MQDNRTEPVSFDAQDPEGNRLTREQVIAINQAHIDGTGWDAIAREHGITRKNVQRIVQGRRWRTMHPKVAPELYRPSAEDEREAGPIILTTGQLTEIVTDVLRQARDRLVRDLST